MATGASWLFVEFSLDRQLFFWIHGISIVAGFHGDPGNTRVHNTRNMKKENQASKKEKFTGHTRISVLVLNCNRIYFAQQLQYNSSYRICCLLLSNQLQTLNADNMK